MLVIEICFFTTVVLKYVLIWFAINSKIVVFLKEYFIDKQKIAILVYLKNLQYVYFKIYKCC